MTVTVPNMSIKFHGINGRTLGAEIYKTIVNWCLEH